MSNSQNIRQYWGTERKSLPQLDLIAIQTDSYNWFLSEGISQGLSAISPIEDFTGKNWRLEFGEHRFGEPKNTPSHAKAKGTTFEIPLKVKSHSMKALRKL